MRRRASFVYGAPLACSEPEEQRPVRSACRNVDLPAPDGPISAENDPGSKVAEMLCRIGLRARLPCTATETDTQCAESWTPTLEVTSRVCPASSMEATGSMSGVGSMRLSVV